MRTTYVGVVDIGKYLVTQFLPRKKVITLSNYNGSFQ